ncbi:ATP citrate (Pro-S)-lyase, partial [Puccinia sorghi]
MIQISWDPESKSITANSSLPSWELSRPCGKAGLWDLNKTWPEAKEWIQECARKPVK